MRPVHTVAIIALLGVPVGCPAPSVTQSNSVSPDRPRLAPPDPLDPCVKQIWTGLCADGHAFLTVPGEIDPTKAQTAFLRCWQEERDPIGKVGVLLSVEFQMPAPEFRTRAEAVLNGDEDIRHCPICLLLLETALGVDLASRDPRDGEEAEEHLAHGCMQSFAALHFSSQTDHPCRLLNQDTERGSWMLGAFERRRVDFIEWCHENETETQLPQTTTDSGD